MLLLRAKPDPCCVFFFGSGAAPRFNTARLTSWEKQIAHRHSPRDATGFGMTTSEIERKWSEKQIPHRHSPRDATGFGMTTSEVKRSGRKAGPSAALGMTTGASRLQTALGMTTLRV